MKRLLLCGGFVTLMLIGAGCEVEATVPGPPPPVGLDVEVGPDYAYYEGGAFVGPYWVWHDRYGHEFREERAVHERRAAQIRDRRAHVEHEEHHEEHR